MSLPFPSLALLLLSLSIIICVFHAHRTEAVYGFENSGGRSGYSSGTPNRPDPAVYKNMGIYFGQKASPSISRVESPTDFGSPPFCDGSYSTSNYYDRVPMVVNGHQYGPCRIQMIECSGNGVCTSVQQNQYHYKLQCVCSSGSGSGCFQLPPKPLNVTVAPMRYMNDVMLSSSDPGQRLTITAPHFSFIKRSDISGHMNPDYWISAVKLVLKLDKKVLSFKGQSTTGQYYSPNDSPYNLYMRSIGLPKTSNAVIEGYYLPPSQTHPVKLYATIRQFPSAAINEGPIELVFPLAILNGCSTSESEENILYASLTTDGYQQQRLANAFGLNGGRENGVPIYDAVGRQYDLLLPVGETRISVSIKNGIGESEYQDFVVSTELLPFHIGTSPGDRDVVYKSKASDAWTNPVHRLDPSDNWLHLFAAVDFASNSEFPTTSFVRWVVNAPYSVPLSSIYAKSYLRHAGISLTSSNENISSVSLYPVEDSFPHQFPSVVDASDSWKKLSILHTCHRTGTVTIRLSLQINLWEVSPPRIINLQWYKECKPSPPAPPSDLSVEQVGSTFLVAAWDKVDGAEGYKLDIASARSSGCQGDWVEKYKGSARKVAITALFEQHTYCLRVSSLSSAGVSSFSDIFIATTSLTCTNSCGNDQKYMVPMPGKGRDSSSATSQPSRSVPTDRAFNSNDSPPHAAVNKGNDNSNNNNSVSWIALMVGVVSIFISVLMLIVVVIVVYRGFGGRGVGVNDIMARQDVTHGFDREMRSLVSSDEQ